MRQVHSLQSMISFMLLNDFSKPSLFLNKLFAQNQMANFIQSTRSVLSNLISLNPSFSPNDLTMIHVFKKQNPLPRVNYTAFMSLIC